jgi:Tfp pilus assembly PilM family ATPase
MNIFNLLSKKKLIIGVEISDNAIRIAYFRNKKGLNKKTPSIKRELVLIEETLKDNIVSGGVVIDKESLGKIFKNIWEKSKIKSNYAIVSIAEDKIYSHIHPFPKTESEKQLKEAIDLAIEFELPVKKNDIYVSSENAGDSNVINEILISAIPKNIADEYIYALNSANIKMLALESHLSSISRSALLKFGQNILFTKRNPKSSTIFIIKDRSVRFSRTISANFIKEDNFLTNEVSRIKTWFESEKKSSVTELPLNENPIVVEYQKYLDPNTLAPEMQSKWLIALGAVMRGEIKEGQDNQISLLPIGTAEAYAYQKMTIFITIMRNITIGISIFFLVVFLLTYFFILSLSKTSNKTNTAVSISTIYPDIDEKENFIQNLNSITSASKEIISATINWSILLDEINLRTINGITISNFSVISINEKISMVGIAKDRETLNQFKKLLQESTYITSVELPITNLGQKADIPFSVSFNLKDPSMLYYK